MSKFLPAKKRIDVSPGESVRIIRELQGLSETQLSSLCDIPQNAISSIETGRVNLGVERARVLATSLHRHPAVLVFPGWQLGSVAWHPDQPDARPATRGSRRAPRTSGRGKVIRSPRVVVQILGAAFAAEGLVGLIHPDAFRSLVIWLQSPPAWPWSVLLRVILGLLLLGVAATARSPGAVRAVGVVTLLGAGVGLFFTSPDQLQQSQVWRLPSLVLFGAGVVVVWGAGKASHAA